jgi:uncharacterized membrane protein
MDVAQQRAARERVALTWWTAHRWTIIVSGAATGWAIALFALVRSQYESFELGRFDLGNMVQAVWSTAQGRPLETTMAGGEQITRLGVHVDPILALVTPLWMLLPSPLTLAAVQIAAVSLGALPVFWLARKHLGSQKAAAVLALAYLASPWIAWNAVDAMHPKTFAIPLFLFAIWFLDNDRLGAFAAAAVATAACGELMGMTIAALGVWYAFARGRRREGLAIAVVGAAWTAVALFVIVPAFSGDESAYYGLYDHVGGSPSGILETAFVDPGAILSALTEGRDVLFLFLLAAPLLGLFVLAPGMALVAAPQLLLNALADSGGPADPRHHYLAGVIPFLFAAVAIGLGRLAHARRVPVSGLVLGVSLLLTVLLGPWPGIEREPIRYEIEAPPGHAEVLRRAVALIPEDAPVSATNKVGAHLAAREYLFTVPVVRHAEWIVVDTRDNWVSHGGLPFLVERPPAEVRAFSERISQSGMWETALAEDGVFVFRRLSR